MKEITKEYAAGLFALASESGREAEIRQGAAVLGPLFTRAYTHILIDPELPKARRVEMVGQALDGRVDPYLSNFVKLMTERGLADEIPGCFEEYERLYCEKFNLLKVTAESAFPLTEEQKRRLTEKLERNTGCSVELEVKITPELLGGLRLSYRGRLIDDSVQAKLKALRERLKK